MTRPGRVKPGCLLGIIVAILCLLWMSNQGQRRMRERRGEPTPAGQTAPESPAPPAPQTPAPAPGVERSP